MIAIFSKLVRALFEPFVVCLAMGMLYCAFRIFTTPKKRERTLLIAVITMIFCAIFWRGAIHISESRYIAILLIPACIMAGAVLFWHRVSHRLAYILVLILCGVCVAKQLRFSSGERERTQLGMLIGTDAKERGKCVILDMTPEIRRLKYYSRLPVFPCEDLIISNLAERDAAARVMARMFSLPADILYFVVSERGDNLTIPADAVGVRPEAWRKIAEVLPNSKRKKLFCVYRLDKSKTNLDFPFVRQENRIPNGDLNERYSRKIEDKWTSEWLKKGMSFYRQPRALPAGWIFDFCSEVVYARVAKAEAELIENDGCNWVRLKSWFVIQFLTKEPLALSGNHDYLLEFSGKGKIGTNIRVMLYFYRDGKLFGRSRLGLIPILDEECRLYRLPIGQDDFPKRCDIRLGFGVEKGEALLSRIAIFEK